MVKTIIEINKTKNLITIYKGKKILSERSYTAFSYLHDHIIVYGPPRKITYHISKNHTVIINNK